jgi:hypothetical protein
MTEASFDLIQELQTRFQLSEQIQLRLDWRHGNVVKTLETIGFLREFGDFIGLGF